jgi:hypothetical protein
VEYHEVDQAVRDSVIDAVGYSRLRPSLTGSVEEAGQVPASIAFVGYVNRTYEGDLDALDMDIDL